MIKISAPLRKATLPGKPGEGYLAGPRRLIATPPGSRDGAAGTGLAHSLRLQMAMTLARSRRAAGSGERPTVLDHGVSWAEAAVP